MADKTADQSRALCPACERFVGPLDTCPYCDLSMPGTFSLRFLRFASLALAIIGMAALYMMAREGQRPVVAVGAVTPQMNSASVRVAGRVASTPQSGMGGSSYFSFPITDGSNRLTVVAYDRCARELICSTNLPGRGDVVEVCGTVSINRPGTKRIIMEAPEQLKTLNRGSSRQAGDGDGAKSDGT